MASKISVIINTLNEEKNIEKAIKSVQWADEILVCDMYSDDGSALIAKKLGAKVIFHKRLSFVEPARNFAISKASHEWILIMDPDEQIQVDLADKLKEVAANPNALTHVLIPRKNIIFGKWMKASMWWPDYNVRFFKSGTVRWSNKIHAKPATEGQGTNLPPEERFSIIHHHYDSVSQYLIRLNRYTTIQAKELKQNGRKFKWQDLLAQPVNEFLGRYFANRGFEDGLHGLTLGLLQAFSFLIVYIKLWEMEGFERQNINLGHLNEESKKISKDITYWFKYGNLSQNPLKRIIQKSKNKLPF